MVNDSSFAMNLTSDRLWCIIGPDSRWRSPSQRDIEVAKVTATWMLARNGHPLSRWCLTSGQQPVAFDQVRLGDPAQRGRNPCEQRVHAIGSNRAVERPGSLVGEAMLCFIYCHRVCRPASFGPDHRKSRAYHVKGADTWRSKELLSKQEWT